MKTFIRKKVGQYLVSKTKKIVLTGSAVITHDVLPRFAQDIKQFFVIIRYKECQKKLAKYKFKVS